MKAKEFAGLIENVIDEAGLSAGIDGDERVEEVRHLEAGNPDHAERLVIRMSDGSEFMMFLWQSQAPKLEAVCKS